MIGDMILITNRQTGKFFAGWVEHNKAYAPNKVRTPVWVGPVEDALQTYELQWAYKVKDEIGPDARIISITEARRIEALRAYRKYQAIANGRADNGD